jgi:hypothetical protein
MESGSGPPIELARPLCADRMGVARLTIVHDMDPPDIFPYKAPQMQRVFGAFAAMLDRRARQSRECAA